MPYKDFSDFKDIQLKFGNVEESLNYGYTASPNFSCENHPLFENDFFLLYRRSEYAAQIEVACAKIFKKLTGYGPELEIVKQDEKFYIASRRIKNFTEGCPTFENPSQYEHTRGLAAIFVIWYFLCQTDTHSGNYGLSNLSPERKAFGLDMAEALDFEMLKTALELSSLQRIPYIVERHYQGVSEQSLCRDFVASPFFQGEKIALIKLIANTPLVEFETIIREVVTSNFYEHLQTMFHQIPAFANDEFKESLAKTEPSDYSIDALIKFLEKRHQQWQFLAVEDLTQDYSLAENLRFMQEANLYHGKSSSSTNSDDEQDVETTPSDYSSNDNSLLYAEHRFFEIPGDNSKNTVRPGHENNLDTFGLP